MGCYYLKSSLQNTDPSPPSLHPQPMDLIPGTPILEPLMEYTDKRITVKQRYGGTWPILKEDSL